MAWLLVVTWPCGEKRQNWCGLFDKIGEFDSATQWVYSMWVEVQKKESGADVVGEDGAVDEGDKQR